ncbi:MAG: MBL fold metallo-hydrolase [Chloroflexi bacterium]|mgnify:FL=1|nr:MBL fold metallo-hydrolase [Chloroflexota bacterium]
MKGKTVTTSYEFTNDTHAISFPYAMPEGPILPINQFVIRGSEKNIMLDTGPLLNAEGTIAALSSVMNPQDLDYIFLTHMDLDHVGGLHEILKLAPKARVVGNMTVMGKGLSMYNIPPHRFAAVFPGQEINLGNHVLRVEESLLEDGHTSWLFDKTTRTFFTSDGFGSLQFGQVPQYAEMVDSNAYAQGFAMWQHMNFHMLPRLDMSQFRGIINYMRSLDVRQIASVHGPIVRESVQGIFDLMEDVPGAELPPHPELPAIFHL